jgi:hypothetical protein
MKQGFLRTAFARIHHEFGGSEIISNRRVAGIGGFAEGQLKLEDPTRIFYRLKIMPNFEHTIADVKLMAHGWKFGPVPQVPGGVMAYSEEMCSHVVKLGRSSWLKAGVDLADFNTGRQISHMFDIAGINDPMLTRIAEREDRAGVLMDTRTNAARHLRHLGYK